jgi:hypothetical protein
LSFDSFWRKSRRRDSFGQKRCPQARIDATVDKAAADALQLESDTDEQQPVPPHESACKEASTDAGAHCIQSKTRGKSLLEGRPIQCSL